ncbi:MAG: serine/threonine protein kinase, partial [Stackebrandtia sp.]
SYVSPEQLRGEPLTGASDIYSLGVVAYEALTGDRPFTGETPAAIISGHLHRTPPPLPDDLPAAVGDAVNQALHKDPQHRYPTARDLAAALRGLGTGLPPAPRGYAPGKAKGRASTGDTDTIAFTTGLRRWIPTGLAALLVLVAILVVVVPWHDDDPGAMAGDSTNSDEPTDDEEDETSASPSHKNVPSGPKSKTGESTSQSSSPTADSGKKTVCADTPDSSSRFHDAGRGCFHADGHYFEVFDDGPDGYRMVVAWRSLDTGRRDTCETTGPAGTSVECVEPLKSGERISFQLQVRNKDDTLWSSENTPATS